MDFLYFLAPEKCMRFLEEGDKLCSFCGHQKRCFLMDFNGDEAFSPELLVLERCTPKEAAFNAHLLAQVQSGGPLVFDEETRRLFREELNTPEDEEDPSLIRLGCFDCLRDGRFGFAHSTGYGDVGPYGLTGHDGQKRDDVPPEAVEELARTPGFYTYQQHIWLTHCDDFMVFLGEWSPEDFNAHAPGGYGKVLFSQVRQVSSEETWESLRGDGIYVFRCRHCGAMESFSDWD